MTKYKFEKPDYIGCNSEIAKMLKEGKNPVCRVWDGDKDEFRERTIVYYITGATYPYRTATNRFKHAEPIPEPERVLKSQRDIIIGLLDHGYKLTSSGYWADGNGTKHPFAILDWPVDTPESAIDPAVKTFDWMFEEVK